MEQAELAKLINECKKGKESAYARLVDLYSKKLYAYFYRLTGNAEIASDLLSELFLKLVKNIKKFKDGSFESWIFRIASNIFHDFLRNKYRSQDFYQNYTDHLEQNLQTEKKTDCDKFDLLQQALDRIEPDQREIIILRYYSQMSFKEIAQLRSEPIGTTLSKLHRSLKKLKELMEVKYE